MIAILYEKGRLPINLIAWFLQATRELGPSQGEIVEASHMVAEHGQEQVAEIHQEPRWPSGRRHNGQDSRYVGGSIFSF